MKAVGFALVLSVAASVGAQPSPAPAPVDRAEMARRVRSEMLDAWKAYEAYAWGHDELKPVSGTARDWYGAPLLMTPVDALDTLLLMGLTEEADKAKALIVSKLDLDKVVFNTEAHPLKRTW
jgi:ER degradation enhancer, mannosidase alpha-like 2